MDLLLPILQSGPPDTSQGLILGYGASAAIFFGYIASMWLRQRSTQKNLEMMEELTNERE
jgi:hypothetical protein